MQRELDWYESTRMHHLDRNKVTVSSTKRKSLNTYSQAQTEGRETNMPIFRFSVTLIRFLHAQQQV